MSYRIAHVRFAPGDRTYPVNCHRTDLRSGDRVVIEMVKGDRRLKRAEVDSVEHLNWNCKNQILCLETEFQRDGRGGWSVIRAPATLTPIDTLHDLKSAIYARGWTALRPTSNVWKVIYARDMPHAGAAIAFRTNGIDFQLTALGTDVGIRGDRITLSPGTGRFVRHWFYNSAVDIMHLALNYALAVEVTGADLSRFFEQVGTSPPKGRAPHWNAGADELSQIRDAINDGSGGPAYLCDDVWI